MSPFAGLAKLALTQMGLPPAFATMGGEKMSGHILLPTNSHFPACSFAHALAEKGRHEMPQAIAHRGYKAKFPENTMAAFRGAAEIGAHAIETDIHITKDDVVVLSHDDSLSRCYGKPDKIIDCEWDELKDLQTIAEPHQTMPRLTDLLEYIAHPDREDLWILLDIKMDNDTDKVMRLIAETIESVDPLPSRPWNQRVVLGIWAANYLPLAQKYSPGFPVSFIGFSTIYARQFFKTPDVSFNMMCPILQAPCGKRFIQECKKSEREVFAWTVNTEDKMDWCIRQHLDGVITDDPKKYLDYCEEFNEFSKPIKMSFKVTMEAMRLWVIAILFASIVKSRLDRVKPPSKAATIRA